MKLFKLFIAGFLTGMVLFGIIYNPPKSNKLVVDYPQEEIQAIIEDSLHPVPMEGFRLSKDTVRIQFTGSPIIKQTTDERGLTSIVFIQVDTFGLDYLTPKQLDSIKSGLPKFYESFNY